MNKSILYILPVIFLLFIFSEDLCSQVIKNDSLALVELFNKTDGKNWLRCDNWFKSNVSNWYGIYVVGNRVTGINLDNNNLSGKIPRQIGNLDALQYLILSDNNIIGEISIDLCHLPNLNCLTMDNNQLNGNIPFEITKLKNLKTLWLSDNNLTGTIPPGLNTMPHLVSVMLHNNNFTIQISQKD